MPPPERQEPHRAGARDAVAFLGANYDGVEFAVVSYAKMRVDTNPLSTDPDEIGRFVVEEVTDVDVHTVTQ